MIWRIRYFDKSLFSHFRLLTAFYFFKKNIVSNIIYETLEMYHCDLLISSIMLIPLKWYKIFILDERLSASVRDESRGLRPAPRDPHSAPRQLPTAPEAERTKSVQAGILTYQTEDATKDTHSLHRKLLLHKLRTCRFSKNSGNE